MSARAKAPKAVEAWAITVDGERFMHDGEKPWIFHAESAAQVHIIEHIKYRRQLVGSAENIAYKPTRVLITPAPRRRKP